MGIFDKFCYDIPLFVHWLPSLTGKFKLNTDGCCRGNLNNSAGVAILRNDKDNVIFVGCET